MPRAAGEAEVVVEFGGKRVVDGAMTFRTDAGASRLVLKDGTVAVFDGKEAWVSPVRAAEARQPRSRSRSAPPGNR